MRRARFQVYQDEKGEHRWRLFAANGRTLADSGEGYTRKADAERAVNTVGEAVVRIENRKMIERIKSRMPQ